MTFWGFMTNEGLCAIMLRNPLTTAGRYVSGARLNLPGRDEIKRQDFHQDERNDSLRTPSTGTACLGAFV